jgi:hypothetical protein
MDGQPFSLCDFCDSDHCVRLQAAQRMQAAAGGKGRGPNGMPTPAQISAMQV